MMAPTDGKKSGKFLIAKPPDKELPYPDCKRPIIVARINACRRAAALLTEHDDADMVTVAYAMNMWLSTSPDAEISFDAALQLPSGWRNNLRRAERDAMLAELAMRLSPCEGSRKAAREVSSAARKYEGVGWLRDRRTGVRPDGVNGLIFDVLRLGNFPSFGSLCRIFSELPNANKRLHLRRAKSNTGEQEKNRHGVFEAQNVPRGSRGN